MFSFRYHGTGVCEVWFTGHLLKEEQELDKHPVEAGGGKAACPGHELPGRNICLVPGLMSFDSKVKIKN